MSDENRAAPSSPNGPRPSGPNWSDRLGRLRFDPTALPIAAAALVLVVAIAWLLTRPTPTADDPVPPGRVMELEERAGALAAEVEALRAEQGRQAAALESRVAALEGVPERVQQLAALEPALRQLEGVPERMRQLGALEERLRALEERPVAPDLAPLREQIEGFGRQAQEAAAQGAGLEQRLAAAEGALRDLAARPVVDPAAVASRSALEELTGRVARLTDRAEALAQQDQQATQRMQALEALVAQRVQTLGDGLTQDIRTARQELGQRITELDGALERRVSALEEAQQRLVALEARAARLAALDGVRAALEAGRPLGEALRGIQEPPRALARFATTPPPTEASLRLSFDEHARAALAASEPAQDGQGVIDSAVSRLSGLVTIRRGEDLVWGDAAAAEIERARRALNAGDVEEALARLERLPPAARDAMRAWTEQAEALIAARAEVRRLALTAAG